MTTEELNRLSHEGLVELLAQLGHSRDWAEAVAQWRPFEDEDALCAASDAAWITLPDTALRAALLGTPPPVIAHGDPATRNAAALALRLYRERYGYPYVSHIITDVAESLLMRVRIRLGNEPASEWRAARDHKRRALRTRLGRLLQPGVSA